MRAIAAKGQAIGLSVRTSTQRRQAGTDWPGESEPSSWTAVLGVLAQVLREMGQADGLLSLLSTVQARIAKCWDSCVGVCGSWESGKACPLSEPLLVHTGALSLLFNPASVAMQSTIGLLA